MPLAAVCVNSEALDAPEESVRRERRGMAGIHRWEPRGGVPRDGVASCPPDLTNSLCSLRSCSQTRSPRQQVGKVALATLWPHQTPVLSRTGQNKLFMLVSLFLSRKLPCPEYWREGIWLQGVLLPQNHPGVHVPGAWRSRCRRAVGG